MKRMENTIRRSKLLLARSARWTCVVTLVCLSAIADADDFGNAPNSALSSLIEGEPIAGMIEVGDDQDWFFLPVDAPANIVVYTTGTLDTVGELYDLAGFAKITTEGRFDPLVEDDDGGDNLNFRIEYKAQPDFYWVRVQSYGNLTGSYVLHLGGQGDDGPTPSNDDHGNTPSSASRLEIGREIRGEIEQSGDADYFRIESDGLQHLEIVTKGGTDTQGHLLQLNGDRVNTLARDYDAGAGRNFRIQTRVGAGTYFIRVEGNGNDTGGYLLETHATYVASRVGPQVNEGRSDMEVGKVFQDCPQCPLMVVIPGGRFRMGRTLSEPGRRRNRNDWFNDLPLSQVRVGGSNLTPFAIGVYEVTYGEWLACHQDGGCSVRGHGHTGGHNYPVSRVHALDAEEYTRWLSRKTGHTYELPTEAEWEYAARAGTQTSFSFGDRINPLVAKYNSNETVPVGSYAPNAFGLHDVHGNVWEWTSDCRNTDLTGISREGRMPSGDCRYRMSRGGAYHERYLGRDVRSASRGADRVRTRDAVIGFRVVRRLRVR